jgi:hypothetical protein
MKKNFSEKWPLSLNRSKQDNINYIFELLIENTLKCNQIKNVHIGENGQGPLYLKKFIITYCSLELKIKKFESFSLILRL